MDDKDDIEERLLEYLRLQISLINSIYFVYLL
jgi:hypothetical protein